MWADDSLFLPEADYLNIYIILVVASIVVGIAAGCFFFVMSMKVRTVPLLLLSVCPKTNTVCPEPTLFALN